MTSLCSTRLVRLTLLPLVLALSTGCSVVKSHMVVDDWAKQDQKQVRRLAVVVQPLPDGQEKVGALFARIARRYVNMKRDFLVKKEVVQAAPVAAETACGGDDHIEGLLRLAVTLVKKGDGFESALVASLDRCGDGRKDWTAEAGSSFPSKDPLLVEITQVYVRELGAEVEAYVAPAMNLLRPALDTLPQPVLTDDDVTEKMGLDD